MLQITDYTMIYQDICPEPSARDDEPDTLVIDTLRVMC